MFSFFAGIGIVRLKYLGNVSEGNVLHQSVATTKKSSGDISTRALRLAVSFGDSAVAAPRPWSSNCRTVSHNILALRGTLHGLPSRNMLDRTYSAQRFSFFVIFLYFHFE